MDQRSGQKRASDFLYPPVEPFDQRMMDMGDGHQVYVEQCGKPDGVPVFVFHGGPGGGCSPLMRRYFDPAHYRIVLFDQRGCGRSTPRASVIRNTTWDLVADAERIREARGIDRYIAFGGSWGATLALITAITHPTRVSKLVLRGVFLMTRAELDWFYGGGAARFWPDRWAEFRAPIPPEEHGDLIAAYHARLFSGDDAAERHFARHWIMWENGLAGMDIAHPGGAASDYARAFARLESHYFRNGCFLDEGQLLRDRARIEHIPCQIVQGRYDMVCPPDAAWRLADGWPGCRLRMVAVSGHALSEPRIAAELVAVMDELRGTPA